MSTIWTDIQLVLNVIDNLSDSIEALLGPI